MPRLRIIWVMVGIAIVEVDMTVIRAMLHFPEIDFFVLGALPMANILVIGTLIARQRPRNRPFLSGFAVSGALTLSLFFALMLSDLDQDGPIFYYLSLGYVPLEKMAGLGQTYIRIPLEFSLVAGMLTMPQLTIALIGGFLSRRFKITITRR